MAVTHPRVVRLCLVMALACATAPLVGCLESDSPSIPDGQQEDLGPTVTYRLWMPPATDAETLQFYRQFNGAGFLPQPGLDAVGVHFKRADDAAYILSLSHLKDGATVWDSSEDSDMLTARMSTLERIGDYKVVLVDVFVKIEQGSHISTVLLTGSDGSAFFGSIPCDETTSAEIRQNAPEARVECQKDYLPVLASLWMYTLRGPAKADWSAGLYAFYQKAVSQRRVTFLIDCSRFDTLRSKLDGFQTTCMSW